MKKLINRHTFPITALSLLALISLNACLSLPEYPLQAATDSPVPEANDRSIFLVETNPPLTASLTPVELVSRPKITSQPTAAIPHPTLTPVPPTLTPTPNLRKLSDDGCCTQPSWSSDGQEVLVFDKSSPEMPAGLWGFNVYSGEHRLVTDQVGIYSPDLSLTAFLINGQTVVERLSDRGRYIIPNGGREVIFSPSSDRIAWMGGSIGPPIDTAWREVWVSAYDGSHPTIVYGAYGGVLAGWSQDGRLLVSGRLGLDDDSQTFWSVDPDGGQAFELGKGFVLRGGLSSPGGSWLAYQALFSDQPSENGLWLANQRSGERIKLELFGSYRWRDDGHLLLFVPDPQTGEHHLWQVEASTGQSRQLRGLESTDHRIAGGDWQVSPAGDCLVFVSAVDGNLWLLFLD